MWKNKCQVCSEIGPTPPPRLQSRTTPPVSHQNETSLLQRTIDIETWPLPPPPPPPSLEHVTVEKEPWPLPPPTSFSDCSTKEEEPWLPSPFQTELPPIPDLSTSALDKWPLPPPPLECHEQLAQLMEESWPLPPSTSLQSKPVLSLSPNSSQETIEEVIWPCPSPPPDLEIQSGDFSSIPKEQTRVVVEVELRSLQYQETFEPPRPPPRRQSRVKSEIATWQLWGDEFYHGERFNERSVTPAMERVSQSSNPTTPEAGSWLAPPLHYDRLTPDLDQLRIRNRMPPEVGPWLASPHQGRVTPEDGCWQPAPPPHQGCVTPVHQMSVEEDKDSCSETPSLFQNSISSSTCRSQDTLAFVQNICQQDHEAWPPSPPPPPHKRKMTPVLEPRWSLPPPPPHQEPVTPTDDGPWTLPNRRRHKQEGVDVGTRNENVYNCVYSSSSTNIFRPCQIGPASSATSKPSRHPPVLESNFRRRKCQPRGSRSENASIQTRTSSSSSFREQVKEILNASELGSCFIM